MSCVVPNCTSHPGRRRNVTEELSFHRFPKDEGFKNQWIQRIGRSHWRPSITSHICSKHFAPEDFTSDTLKWRRLKETALPVLQPLSELEQLLEMSDTDEMTRPSGPVLPVTFVDVGANDSFVEQFEGTEHCVQPRSKAASKQSRGMNPESTTCVITQRSCNRVLKKPKDIKMMEAFYLRKVQLLEKELERAKLVSKRRLVKINTLQKRLGRLSKKNTDLFNLLMERVKKENLEEEYLDMLEV